MYKILDQRRRLLIAMNVAFGMEYLHVRNIVHFDFNIWKHPGLYKKTPNSMADLITSLKEEKIENKRK